MILKSCRSLTMIFFLGMDVWMNNIELNSTISPGLIWPKPTATEARLVARLEASRQEMAETRDIVDVVVVVVGVLCSGAESGLRLRRENIGRYNGRVVALYRPLYTSWTTRDFWHSLEGCSKLGINVSSSQTLFIIPRIVRTPLGWENYPPTLSKLITLCGMFWSHLWVHLWKYFAALAINS